MSNKTLSLLAALLAPAFLAGCPVYVDSLDSDPNWNSPAVTVVAATSGTPQISSTGTPVYTHGSAADNPIIDSFTQNISEVKAGQPITFTVVAHDPAGAQVQYNWSSTGGALSADTGRIVSWNPPTTPGIFTVTVEITNAQGGVATGALNLTVSVPGVSPAPVASATPAAVTTYAPIMVGGGTAAPVASNPPIVVATPTPTPTPVAVQTPATAAATPAPVSTAGDATKSTVDGVVDDNNGGVAGVEVSLSSTDSSNAFVATTTTDANGAYRFAGVPADIRFVLTTHKTGYADRSQTLTTTAGQESVFDFNGSAALVKQ